MGEVGGGKASRPEGGLRRGGSCRREMEGGDAGQRLQRLVEMRPTDVQGHWFTLQRNSSAWPCLQHLLLLGTVGVRDGRGEGLTKQPDFSYQRNPTRFLLVHATPKRPFPGLELETGWVSKGARPKFSKGMN